MKLLLVWPVAIVFQLGALQALANRKLIFKIFYLVFFVLCSNGMCSVFVVEIYVIGMALSEHILC